MTQEISYADHFSPVRDFSEPGRTPGGDRIWAAQSADQALAESGHQPGYFAGDLFVRRAGASAGGASAGNGQCVRGKSGSGSSGAVLYRKVGDVPAAQQGKAAGHSRGLRRKALRAFTGLPADRTGTDAPGGVCRLCRVITGGCPFS